MEEVCYEKVLDMVRAGHQVMVFVHARNATGKTALAMKETAQQNGEIGLFEPESSNVLGQAKVVMQKSRNRQLQELFPAGFGKSSSLDLLLDLFYSFLTLKCSDLNTKFKYLCHH